MVSQRQSRLEGHRRKFLAVVDDSPESTRAVRYAGMRAKNSATGGLVLLYVISDADFNQWIGVAEVMRAEAREEADSVMAKVAQDVRENIGHEPELVIREGKATEQILQLIEEDRDIAILVLAASSGKDGPGPLVTSVAGRGTPFPIPVTIVPDTLTDEEIAALA